MPKHPMNPGEHNLVTPGIFKHSDVTDKLFPDSVATTEARAAAEARALAIAKQNQKDAGPNTGDSSNERSFSGESAYSIPGREILKFAETPEEILAWEKSTPEQREVYDPQEINVTKSVSDRGEDKIPEKKETPPRGHYSYGSNMHNMGFTGGSESFKYHAPGTAKRLDERNKTYSVTPDYILNRANMKPNTWNVRPLTKREADAKKSRFHSGFANPAHHTKAGWDNYLTRVEAAESKLKAKVKVRDEARALKTLEKKAKIAALKAKKEAELAKRKKNKQK
jgi:ribosomal protein L28